MTKLCKGQIKRTQQRQEEKFLQTYFCHPEAVGQILLTYLGKCGCLLTEQVPSDIHIGMCLPLQYRYGCSLRCYCDSLQFLQKKGKSAHSSGSCVAATQAPTYTPGWLTTVWPTQSSKATAWWELASKRMWWKPIFNCTISCVCHFTMKLRRNSVQKLTKLNHMLAYIRKLNRQSSAWPFLTSETSS